MDGTFEGDGTGRGKWLAGAFGVVLLGAVLFPVAQNWRETPKDSFPLSYYPMFTADRGGEHTFSYLVGLDADGTRHVVPHRLAGKGGFNQTRRQINKMIREKRAKELCAAVAARVAQDRSPALAGVVRVQVVSGTYALDDYFAGNTAPVSEKVRATCIVERGAK